MNYLNWTDAEFGMSRHSADRFMNVASRLGDKSSTVQHLQPTALYLLSAPSTDDELVQEVTARASGGEMFSAADIKAMKDKWAAEWKGPVQSNRPFTVQRSCWSYSDA